MGSKYPKKNQFNLEKNFTAEDCMQMEKGFALIDIIRELHPWLFAIDLPGKVRQQLVVALADIEHNLSVGTNPRLQLAGVVGAFATARAGIVEAGKA